MIEREKLQRKTIRKNYKEKSAKPKSIFFKNAFKMDNFVIKLRGKKNK